MPHIIARFTLILVFVLTFAPSGTNAQGNNCAYCRELLAGGVFDETKGKQSNNKKSFLKAYLCTLSFGEAKSAIEKAVGVDASVSFPIVEIGLPIGGSGAFNNTYNEEKYNTWKNSSCSGRESEDFQSTFQETSTKVANTVLITEFVKCMQNCVRPPAPPSDDATATTSLVRVWNVIHNQKQVTVYIRYNMPTGDPSLATVKEDVIVPVGVKRSDVITNQRILLRRGQTLSSGVIAFPLERSPGKTFPVKVNTNKGGGVTFVDQTPYSALYKYDPGVSFEIDPQKSKKIRVVCSDGTHAIEASAVCTTGMGLCTFLKAEDEGAWWITITNNGDPNNPEKQTARGHTFAVCEQNKRR